MEAINFKELRKYESFTTIDEMDDSIRQYTEHLRNDVAQSVVDVLWCLGRSSLRVVGISFKKQGTIAELIGLSRKTVNKAIKTLESLGVIDSVRTKTKKGRPSVKIIRILPFCLEKLHQAVTSNEVDEANNDVALTPIEIFESINLNQQKSFNTLDNNVDQVENHSFDKIDDISPDQLNDFIPEVIVEKEFVDLAKPYFGTRKILSLSRALNNGLKSVGLTFIDPYVPEAVKNAFKATVFAYKGNRIHKNFASYFFGVLKSELSVVLRKNARDNGKFYDWLNVSEEDQRR
ncbi:hypothetical protein BC359_18215 [Priestia flexa]|nr:hypothetical protein BC359_18215 [Priestia flexa]